jgi:hypothetical protein
MTIVNRDADDTVKGERLIRKMDAKSADDLRMELVANQAVSSW